MKILAIDPATNCGWAVAVNGDVVAAGTWDLSVRRDESSGMRLIRLRSKLQKVAESFGGVDLVVFEAARFAGPKMQGSLIVTAQLNSIVMTWAHDTGAESRGYSSTEIKKYATGKGNAGKPMMVEAAKDKWESFTGDDNEADARWLADLAATEYDPEA